MIMKVMMVVAVLIIRMIPILISFYAATGKRKYSNLKKMQITTIVVGANLLVFEVAHCLLRGYVNFFATIYYIYTCDFTYQELLYFPISFLICYIAAIIIGKVCGSFFSGDQRCAQELFPVHSAIAVLFLILCYISFSGKNHIVINEVCSNNNTCYVGSEYTDSYCDYVEIRNTGVFAYEIDQLWLSDDSNNLKKHLISGTKIASGECLVIGLDNSTLLSIASAGEWIFLSDGTGRILDQVYSVSQEPDVAYSRINSWWELRRCSPGVGNEEAACLVKVPDFSEESGFFDEPFYLELSSEEKVAIYYSLDGSVPDENANRYTDAIYVYDRSSEANKWNSVQNVVSNWKEYEVDETLVDKAYIIRAVAIDAEGNKSNVVTATYFVGKNYENKNVISLIAEPDELFGDNGICVTGKDYDKWYLAGGIGSAPDENFLRRGREAEIDATLELFKGESVLKQEVGIRVMGSSARGAPKKRFTVTARKEYAGTKWFDYQLFGDYDTHSFSIREGFANAFAPVLVKDRDVATLELLPVEVYLNGEYWYTSYITERYTEETLASKFDVEEDNILISEEGIVKDSDTEENVLQNEIYAFIESHDLTETSAYEEFCDIVDIQSYIDWCCINLYLCNVDCFEERNCIMWRSREVSDGKHEDRRWRWAIYDMDAIEWQWDCNEFYGVDFSAEKNNFAIKGPFIVTSIMRSKMFMGLRENEEFCKQFVLSFLDIANTDFSEEQVSERLTEWGQDISWNQSFFLNRKEYALKYLAEEMGLTGTLEKLSISINDYVGGEITVNTATPKMKDNNWSGEYFTDYPVTVSAQPKEGYRFVRWTGDFESEEEAISFVVEEGGSNIHAVFEKIV